MADENRERKKSAPGVKQMFAEAMKDLLPYTNLPYQMLAAILVFFGIGYGLDSWLDTKPACTVGGSILGVIFGLYTFIVSANELHNKSRMNRKSSYNHHDDTE